MISKVLTTKLRISRFSIIFGFCTDKNATRCVQQTTTDKNTKNIGNNPLPLDKLIITAMEPRHVEAIIAIDDMPKKFSLKSSVIWSYVIIICVLSMGQM